MVLFEININIFDCLSLKKVKFERLRPLYLYTENLNHTQNTYYKKLKYPKFMICSCVQSVIFLLNS